MGIGFGEVAFKQAVLAFIFDYEWEVRGDGRDGEFRCGLRAEEDGEGIGPHGLDEDGAVGDLVEFGAVHWAPEEPCAGVFVVQR